MLILARKVGEQVRIGADITVTVTEVDGRTVRLGIDAPKSVPIYRPELSLLKLGGIEQRAEAARPFAEGGAE